MRTFLLGCMTALTAASWSQVRAIVAGQVEPQQPAAHHSAESNKSAKQYIFSSMSRLPVANVRVVISQRLFYTSNVFQQIKVEMSRDGKLHQVVLAPLSLQGMEAVDDGHISRTYTPDDKCIIEQPSARNESEDAYFRMKLVEQNYTLQIDGRDKVAGRNAVVIKAVPKNDSLETRCYSFDEKTGFLLRLETCKEGRAPMLHLEAKLIEFPAQFSDNTFRLDAPFSRTEHFSRKCVSPSAKDELRDDLGFEPVIPNNLPFGFAAQELQASTDSRSPTLIVRITDGLAKATVLQWRRVVGANSQAPDGTRFGTSGTLTMLVSGDIPDEEKDRILNAFLRAARSRQALNIPAVALSWVQELGCDTNMFSMDREPQDWIPTIFALPAMVRV